MTKDLKDKEVMTEWPMGSSEGLSILPGGFFSRRLKEGAVHTHEERGPLPCNCPQNGYRGDCPRHGTRAGRTINQRHLVEASMGDVHQHDVSPRKKARQQTVHLAPESLELLRSIIRQEIQTELRNRDRRSGSGD